MDTTIETDRLIIRNINPGDYKDLLNLHSDPIVQEYTGETTINTVEEVIQASEERTFMDYKTYGYGRWAVVLKSNNCFVSA